MPDFPIVDSHVHFWDSGVNRVAWTAAHPALDRPFLPADLDADRGEIELAALVVVEADVDPGLYLKEASWAVGLAERDARIGAVVAHAPLHYGGAVGSELEKLAAQPIVRGVRRLIQGPDGERLCGDRGFREAVRMLARFGLHFELCLTHDQLPAVLDLVAACPEVRFVLDHIAKPGIAAGLRDPWWRQIKQLAAFDHVVGCKISGVATEADHGAWTEDELRPYVDRALEVFGPERVMFGSDWPVMRLAVAYPRWVEIVDRAVADWSETDRRRLFADNATRVYGLDR
jgi:L-fuconolactonase